MAVISAQHHCDTRQAGQLYAAWRDGSAAIRKRIVEAPDLFLGECGCKANSKTDIPELFRDLEMVVAIVNRAHRRLAVAAVAAVAEMIVRSIVK